MSEVTLEKWRIAQFKNGIPYLLADWVAHHPVLGSGRFGHSTYLVWIDTERGLGQSINTLYRLGTPHPDVDTPEMQALIEALHPSNIPAEIRRAHGERLPWPGNPDFDEDIVRQWIIERWTDVDAD